MPRPARALSAREGLEKSLRELDKTQLARVGPALVAMARGLAKAADDDPGNAALWRELRQALKDLREAASSGTDDDAAQFRISIQASRMRPDVRYGEDA